MFWDDLVRRLRRQARVISPQLLRGAGGHVAVLPAPRRRRSSRRVLLLLVLLVAVGAALLIGSGRVPPSSTEAEPHVLLAANRPGGA